MTNEVIVALVIVALCFCSVCLLCWRLAGGLHGHHQLDSRSRERERRDFLQMIERLMEKRETPDVKQLDLAHIHRAERMQKNALDAQTDAEALKTAAQKAIARPPKATAPQPPQDEIARQMLAK